MRRAGFGLLLAASLLWGGEPTAPAPKEVLRLLLASHAVKLSVHSTCKGVGSEAKDRDLGDHLAGLLADFTQPEGQNRIEASAGPAERPDAWFCIVNILRRDPEERWAWGVTFLVRKKDRKVVPGSFRCIGAG